LASGTLKKREEPRVADFTDAQVTYLNSQRLGRLATRRPDGTLQNNPVGFRFDEPTGTFEIGGFNMGNSRKYKNVEANGQVAFVVDDLETVDPWKPRMVEVRGTGEVIPADDPGKALIRIHPKRVISFGIE
jgi:pyridoxamine 5'-phosphate oxidase family protein